MSEQQRVAIVTGAAGGIGRELVLGLLGKRLKVAAVDRTAQGLVELAQAAQQWQQGGNLMTIEADLTRDESIDEIVSKARAHFGMIDILVNNAGVGQATVRSDNRQHPIKFWEVSPEQWKLFVAVHTSAPMALSRALVHDMMRQKWGRIVNVTTSLGDDPRRLADLWPVKGSFGSLFGDHGQGPYWRWQRGAAGRENPGDAVPLLRYGRKRRRGRWPRTQTSDDPLRRRRGAPAAPTAETTPDERLIPSRLAA